METVSTSNEARATGKKPREEPPRVSGGLPLIGHTVAFIRDTIGLLMLVTLFFGGFITIGGEWFQMWKSTQWNGLDPAFRNATLALVTLVLVHLPAPVWARVTPRTEPSKPTRPGRQ